MGCLWKLCVWGVDINKLKQSKLITTTPPHINMENNNQLKLKIMSKSFKHRTEKNLEFIFLSPK